jgi:penicillin V acylase-like amidase (Ntn superfamily)
MLQTSAPPGILNTVFITKGVVASASSDSGLEFTQYTVLKLPQKRQFYFKDYENTQWRMLDLKNMNMNASAYLPLADGTMGVKDVSADFK